MLWINAFWPLENLHTYKKKNLQVSQKKKSPSKIIQQQQRTKIYTACVKTSFFFRMKVSFFPEGRCHHVTACCTRTLYKSTQQSPPISSVTLQTRTTSIHLYSIKFVSVGNLLFFLASTQLLFIAHTHTKTIKFSCVPSGFSILCDFFLLKNRDFFISPTTHTHAHNRIAFRA